MVKVIAIISSSAATRPIWQITQRQCLSRYRSARKLSITQEQSGQRITAVHLEQAERRSVREKIDRLRRRETLVGSEPKGV
jgi:hypothetical protein